MIIYKKMLAFVGILLAISLFIIFVIKRNVEQSTQVGLLPNVYSDGWFEFSFHYPLDARVVLGGTQPSFGTEVNIYKENSHAPTCIIGLYRNSPYHDNYIDQVYEGFKPDSTMTFGSLTWKKRRIQSNNFLYGFKSTVWFTLTDEFMFKMLANERNDESYCQKILSSLTPSLDPNVESAALAQKVKQVALDYAHTNFPDKKYLEGAFTKTGAFVLVSNSTSVDNLQGNKFIFLDHNAGVWEISRISDYSD